MWDISISVRPLNISPMLSFDSHAYKAHMRVCFEVLVKRMGTSLKRREKVSPFISPHICYRLFRNSVSTKSLIILYVYWQSWRYYKSNANIVVKEVEEQWTTFHLLMRTIIDNQLPLNVLHVFLFPVKLFLNLYSSFVLFLVLYFIVYGRIYTTARFRVTYGLGSVNIQSKKMYLI